MVEFKNSEELRKWFEGQPREFSVVIASRAALRVVPLLGGLFDVVRVGVTPSKIILAVFRALALSFVASKYPAEGKKLTFGAAADDAHAAYDVYAADAADAAAYALDAAYAAADAVYAADVADVADASLLEAGMTSERLARHPLWPDKEMGGLASEWRDLKNKLLALNEDWQVWTGWYEDILVGRNRAGLPDDLAQDLDLKIATQDDDWWQRGAAAVNKDIAVWTEEANKNLELREGSTEDRQSAIESMADWFLSKFEDPAMSTPHESREGGYIYLKGGPYDANDEIGGEFGDQYSQEWIEEAVNIVQADGIYDWEAVDGDDWENYGDEDSVYPRPPDPGPGPQYDIVDGRLSIVAQLPQPDEVGQQAGLHRQIKKLAGELAGAVGTLGNRFPAFVNAAREYAALVASELDDLDVVAVWAAGGAMASFAQSYREQNVSRTLGEPLEPDVDAMLQSVVRVHGAFILGFAEGRDLVERADAFALDRKRLAKIEQSGNVILSELTDNRELVEERTRDLHRPVRDAVYEFGWTAGRNGYSGYLIVRNITRVTIKFTIGDQPNIATVVGLVTGVSILAGDPNMEFARAAIPFLQHYGSRLLSFFNHSPEMRAYVEWALRLLEEDNKRRQADQD